MLEKATQWILNHHIQGQAIPITHQKNQPYPEVTGYYIPTLLSLGQITLAEQFARWLVTVQNKNGSFSLDNPTISYVFDTGQIIRGWVSILNRLPELAEPLKRACDWIINSGSESGRLVCPAPFGDWNLGERGEVNEAIHLYVLKPLFDAAQLLNHPYIATAAERSLNYYLKNSEINNFKLKNSLTHFYGYIQEALVELNCHDHARKGMAEVSLYQENNGAVPAYHDVSWICSTGLAQLAKVWYLLNDTVRADKAMHFLMQLQNGSGGFYGSYGINANYFPTEEISWATKYAIDAEQLRIARHFDKTVHHYSPTIRDQDGRAKLILSELNQAKRILDAGCGKGRYAKLIKEMSPSIEIHAVDISDEMLSHVPSNIHTKKSSVQDLPYPNDHFDLVYCVETLEHLPNPYTAIKEMIRVLNPGGRLIIIDKNSKKQGALKIETWERWFDIDELNTFLQASHLKTRTECLSYDEHPADGLFIAWIGIK